MTERQIPGQMGPMTGPALAITAVALALGTFMQVLDSTIANVSLPTISGNLGVSTGQGTWVVTSFAVANGISVPMTGWLMQRYGVVKTFVVSVCLFTVASLLCGLSWSMGSLILFRVLQGGTSGPLIPGSQALLISIFPPERRGTALGVWSVTTLVAPVCGPLLGGYISDNWSWPWIFFINVPVGAICAFLCWRNMAARETPSRQVPVDAVGIGLLVSFVGSLQIMLDTGKDADWFNSPAIVVLACLAVVSFLAWIIWETTTEHPIVDLSLFRSRNFALGTVAYALSYAIFFGNNLILPLWLQTQVGYVATWAGMVAAPGGVVALLCTPLATRALARFDARLVASAAMVAFAASYFMRAGLTPDANFLAFAAPMVLQGFSMSVFFVALITICLADVSPARMPAAAGLSNFSRYTFGSFAASITTTIWDNRETVHQSRISENAPPSVLQATLARLHHVGLDGLQALDSVTRIAVRQAYAQASIDFFWISGWLMLLAIPVVWLTRKPGRGAPVGGGD
ncbi:MAG: DHA2 family efflux MFS transporter permease subunit [Caulobacteraceae bacterium]|nr:DHA2 family efflux MFS transporter permease subunit [Caulobacteraceae bacterium]